MGMKRATTVKDNTATWTAIFAVITVEGMLLDMVGFSFHGKRKNNDETQALANVKSIVPLSRNWNDHKRHNDEILCSLFNQLNANLLAISSLV